MLTLLISTSLWNHLRSRLTRGRFVAQLKLNNNKGLTLAKYFLIFRKSNSITKKVFQLQKVFSSTKSISNTNGISINFL